MKRVRHGENNGADTARLLNAMPDATIHCFEPDPRPVQNFCLSDDDRVTLHQIAISDQDGESVLYLSGGSPPRRNELDWDRSSSIRRPTGHLARFPWCTFSREILVQTRSLDSWYRDHSELKRIDFIWADIQGAEIDLIRGGRDTLRYHTKYLYTEFYNTPMYEGQVDLAGILQELPAFRCRAINNGNALLENIEL
ncbi:FkbM family methyltransferase [bacterium]|nr:FkbM family methyltransferase [bacterium]